MTVNLGLLVTLEAKPGKEGEVEEFLRQGRVLVQDEPDTLVWFATRLGPSTFGIFDAFATDEGRQRHLTGKVATALGEIGTDLLASPPQIRPVEVIADKIPG
jgi:quinol monooxygenase YgiN